MADYNRAIICGRLGQDADLKYTAGGTAVSTISVATSEVWTGTDGKKGEKTEWHRVVIWAKQAEVLSEYLVKGKQVLIEGRLQTRKWTDKNQIDRYTTEIRADRVVLLGGGKGNGKGGVPHPAETADATSTTAPLPAPTSMPEGVDDDDSIPF